MKKILPSLFTVFSFLPSKASAGFTDFLLDPFGRCKVNEKIQSQNEEVSYSYTTYENKSKSSKRAVLILPPTGGKNIIDRGYAAMFCKKGFKVYILESWSGIEQEGIAFDLHQKYQTSAQKAIFGVLTQISEEKISVMGTSAGAINFSVSLTIPEVTQKVSEFFSIVSGGPLCKVIASAGEEGLREVRKKRMQKFNIQSFEVYEDKICKNLDWDTAKKKPDHMRVASVVALNDETVLTQFQKQLAKELDPELTLELDTGHRGAVIKTFLFHRKKVLKFFTDSSN
jgi:hypothetical protein